MLHHRVRITCDKIKNMSGTYETILNEYFYEICDWKYAKIFASAKCEESKFKHRIDLHEFSLTENVHFNQ